MIKIEPNEPHEYKGQLAYYGIGQMQLSRALGISQGHLSNLLNGHKQMPPEIEKEIGEFLQHLKKAKKRKLN